jgi:hypothetical protein
MFGKTSVQEPVQENAPEIEVKEPTDQELLAKGHPSMRNRYTSQELWAMSPSEEEIAWNTYYNDLDTYHAAYLRVHGVECRDCSC